MTYRFTPIVWLVYLTVSVISLQAQVSSDIKQVSDVYLLKNCFVIPKPGVLLAGQDILIKNGKIADIGKQLKKPFDALEIKLDSMYVYAGFIDAFSHTGIAAPEEKERPKVSNVVYPQSHEAGITPQNQAKNSYKNNDKSVGEMRSVGFTMSNVVPRGYMLPGSSDVFILGDKPGDLPVIRAESGQHFQFVPMRGVYPGTIIGVMAKFRELYKNAEIYGKQESMYKAIPTLYNRPEYSRELEALYQVTAKNTPLFIKTIHAKDIYRALKLRSELGFDLVLADVQQGWEYIEEIKKNNIKILLSLELPTALKSDKTKDSTVVQKSDFDVKKEQSIKKYHSQAAAFEKAGVPFAFSTMSVKSGDIKKNLITMIENGLSENAALSALTTYPAQLLGIANQVGTVDKGKMANLVIMDKPYFEEKSTVRYVFLEGVKHEYASRSKSKDANNKDAKSEKYTGVWSYVVEVPGSTQEGKINITYTNGQYSISMFDNTRPYDVTNADDIHLEDDKFTFSTILDMGQPIKLEFTLNMNDKKYAGTVSVGTFGSYPLKGEWLSNPDNF